MILQKVLSEWSFGKPLVTNMLVRSKKAVWKIENLFASGEQGWVYDLADINRYMGEKGPEIVLNGDASNGTTGWVTAPNSSLTVVGGEFESTKTAASNDSFQLLTGLTVGKTYLLSVVLRAGSNSTGAKCFVSASNNTVPVYAIIRTASTSSATLSAVFVAAETSHRVYMYGEGSVFPNTIYVDNISVKELTAISTATLFQDSAGTIPVTAVEQPVGLVLDKSQGLILGPELVTNGDFSNGTTGWTTNGAAIASVDAQRLKYTGISGNNDIVYQAVPTTIGKWYEVRWTAENGTAIPRFCVGSAVGNSALVPLVDSAGTFSARFFATHAAAYVQLATAYSLSEQTTFFDNLSVKLLPGNHAYQATAAKRPLLRSRVNLLTYSEQFDNAVWNKTRTTITPNAALAPDGTMSADKLVENTGFNNHQVAQLAYTPGIANATGSVYLKAAERTYAMLRVIGSANGAPVPGNVGVDLTTGQITGTNGTLNTFGIESAGNGWWRVYANTNQSTTTRFDINVYTATAALSGAALDNPLYQGDGVSGIYVWGGQITNTAGLKPYQWITTATNYDTEGFPLYLQGDGVDDFLQTSSIDFTGTDAVTSWCGFMKLDNSTWRVIYGTSANFKTTEGTFGLSAPFNAGTNEIQNRSRGTSNSIVSTAAYATPFNGVATTQQEISSDTNLLQINADVAVSNSTDQGTGNYSSNPAYFMSLGGTARFFNGHLYSSVCLGRTATAAELTKTRAWVAKRCGVTL